MRLTARCYRKLVSPWQRKRRTALALVTLVCLVVWIVLLSRGLELRDLRPKAPPSRLGATCPADDDGTVCIGFATEAFGSYGYWEQMLQRDRVPACSAECRLVADPAQAHGLLFHAFDLPSRRRLRRMRATWPSGQYWIFYSLESPVHLATNRCLRDCRFDWPLIGSALAFAKEFLFPSYLLRSYPDTTEEAGYFNWTVTYRRDSTVYSPYARFGRIGNGSQEKWLGAAPTTVKRHLSFIVVSNCQPYNRRQDILSQLSKHMELHVYGACGDRSLPSNVSITELSKSYYFHLSFENAFCRDYITEKFFANGLSGHSVPVVFGGFSRSDYEAVAPPNSFLYAGDFNSAASLARRMRRLADSPAEYETYHWWRRRYAAVDSAASRQLNLFCQLCDRLRGARGAVVRPPRLDLNKFYDSGSQCRPADFDPFTGSS